MVAKYIGILDWKVAHLLIDEYYCDAVAELTMTAVRKMVALAYKVTAEDEEAAGAIMEALVLSGLAKMCIRDRSQRPPSHTSAEICSRCVRRGASPTPTARKMWILLIPTS